MDKKGLLIVKYAECKGEISSLALLFNPDKIHLLSLINNPKFLKENSASFLIDAVLKENIHQTDFDFMGSSIPSIARFFKSFGAQNNPFSVVHNPGINILKTFLP